MSLRHRVPYTSSLFKVSIALLNPYQANNNQKSTHIHATGYPRLLAVVFMVASTFSRENKEIDPSDALEGQDGIGIYPFPSFWRA